MRSILLVALAALINCAQVVRADFVLASTYDGSSFAGGSFSVGYDGGVDSSAIRAEKFTVAGSTWLSSLTLPAQLRDPAVNISQFDLMIVSDVGGAPGTATSFGSILWQTNPTGLSTTAANTTYAIPNVPITSGNYWVVLAQNVTLAGDTGSGLGTKTLNGINWYFATAFDPSGARAVQNFVNSSGLSPQNPLNPSAGWTVQTTSSPFTPFAFQLTAVPEPGQVAMTGVLLLGLLGYGVRRKLQAA